MKYRQYSKRKGLEVDYDKTWVAKYNKQLKKIKFYGIINM